MAKLGPPGSSALTCCSRGVGDRSSTLLFATMLGLTLGWRKGVLLFSHQQSQELQTASGACMWQRL